MQYKYILHIFVYITTVDEYVYLFAHVYIYTTLDLNRTQEWPRCLWAKHDLHEKPPASAKHMDLWSEFHHQNGWKLIVDHMPPTHEKSKYQWN